MAYPISKSCIILQANFAVNDPGIIKVVEDSRQTQVKMVCKTHDRGKKEIILFGNSKISSKTEHCK